MKSYNEWKEQLNESQPATNVDQMSGQPVGNMLQKPTKQLGDVARVTSKMDQYQVIQKLASKINNRQELLQFLSYILKMVPVDQNMKAAALRQLVGVKENPQGPV